MLKLGEKSISKLYVGDKAIKKAYWDDKLVYRNYPIFLDYIETDSTQYIDTGYCPNQNTYVEYTFECIKTPTASFNGLFGSRQGTSTYEYSVFVLGSLTLRLDFGKYTEPNSVYKIELNNKYIMKAGLGEIYINDKLVKTYEPKEGQSPYPMYLGNFNNAGNPYTPASPQKIYPCSIYENDVLLHDFRPCIHPNGTVCMYDMVTKKYFYNQGTGEFLYGRQIHEIEYLESTGTQYIDTGITGNSDTKAELAVIISTEATGNVGIFGSRGSSANSNLLAIGYGTSSLASDFNNSSYSNFRASIPYELNTKYICYTSKEKRFIKDENGIVLAENTTLCNDTMSTSNLLLFAETGVALRQQGKMFYAKIWDDNILIRDYIPAVDENGKGFMFDKVTHTIYDNAGTGDFIAGGKV